MKKIIPPLLIAGALLISSAYATVITFTGGNALDANGNIYITAADSTYYNIQSYTENGYELDYITTGNYQAQTVGNYYYTGNDVIHGHWSGGLQSIDVKSISGATFDLNYFTITSNTSQGGGPHTGNEQIYVQGYRGGEAVTGSYLLPGEDWGMNTTSDIVLSSEFDNVDLFRISGSGAFCFGMDAFYINESAPANVNAGGGFVIGNPGIDPSIPESSSALIGGLGLLTLLRRKR
jgi:hypothetical protein